MAGRNQAVSGAAHAVQRVRPPGRIRVLAVHQFLHQARKGAPRRAISAPQASPSIFMEQPVAATSSRYSTPALAQPDLPVATRLPHIPRRISACRAAPDDPRTRCIWHSGRSHGGEHRAAQPVAPRLREVTHAGAFMPHLRRAGNSNSIALHAAASSCSSSCRFRHVRGHHRHGVLFFVSCFHAGAGVSGAAVDGWS